jgi:hypothetical protein
MNYPGNPSGNWTWRMPAGCLDESLKEQVQEINFLYSRNIKEEELKTLPAVPEDYFEVNGVLGRPAPSTRYLPHP